MTKINWPDLNLPPINLWVLVPAYKMKNFRVNTYHDISISDREWLDLVLKELRNLSGADLYIDGMAYAVERFRGEDEEVLLGPMSDLDKAIVLISEKLKEKYNGKS